jgi:hypothetical protein
LSNAQSNECAVQSINERLGRKERPEMIVATEEKEKSNRLALSIAPENSMMIVQVLHFDRSRVYAA